MHKHYLLLFIKMISSTAFHIFGGFLGIIYFHFSEIFFLKKRGIFKRIVFFSFLFIMVFGEWRKIRQIKI